MLEAEDLTLQRLAIGSVFAGLVALGLKFAAYALTGSIALYSDALEGIINVATAVAVLLALRYSAKPADANHPYGHYKAEYFSVVLEGVLIVVASISIATEAWSGYFHPHALDQPFAGLAVNALATVLNATWSFVLIRQG